MSILQHPDLRQDLAVKVARALQDILRASLEEYDAVASGDLLDSIRVYPTDDGRIEIAFLDYGEVLNEGLAGQEINKNDNRNFIAAFPRGSAAAGGFGISSSGLVFVSERNIYDWVVNRNITPYGGIDRESLSYAIQHSLIREGYEKRPWIDQALAAIDMVFPELIGVLVEDTLDEIIERTTIATRTENVRAEVSASDADRVQEIRQAVRIALGILRK